MKKNTNTEEVTYDEYVAYKMYEKFVEEWEQLNGTIREPNIVPYEYQEIIKTGHNERF